jgi:hypothetical protein
MTVNRRNVLAAGLGLSAAATAAATGGEARAASSANPREAPSRPTAFDIVPGLQVNVPQDQSTLLQAAIDRAAELEVPLILPPFAPPICGCARAPG